MVIVMLPRGWIAALMVVALVGAGCVEDAGVEGVHLTESSAKAPPPTAAPSQAPEPTVSAETGAISVQVTTTELQPVASAQVEVESLDLYAFTDPAGQATFSDLSPGRYTILVAKPGFKSTHEKGKVVDVVAGEITEVKLVLEPVEVVTAENKYQRSLPINGFMACAFWITFVGYNNNCGRGVYTAGGQQYGNPNDKTVHPWVIENAQVQTVVFEVKWTSAQELLGKEFWARIMSTWACETLTQGQTCGPYNQMKDAKGLSPVAAREDELPDANITKRINVYSKTYPYTLYLEVRPWCVPVTGTPPGNCTHNIMFNQKYEGFATAFYGEAAPPGFSVYPK